MEFFSNTRFDNNSHVNSVVFNYLILFIHSFRMSSFYLISGFFAMMLRGGPGCSDSLAAEIIAEKRGQANYACSKQLNYMHSLG